MIQQWEELHCSKCDGTDLVPIVKLIWKDGQGTSPKPHGYQCAKCHATIDAASLIQGAKQKQLDAKIKELQSEAQ